MNKNAEVLELILIWVSKVGRKEALTRLITRGVGIATADKLCSGRYESMPRELLSLVLYEEMAKDGITSTNVIAS